MEINWHHYMRMALTEAKRSPDPSTQNGAICLNSDRRIVSVGCNTFTKGSWLDLSITPRETKYKYVEHAERMALFAAHRCGEKVETLVAPWASCAECARAIVECGCRRLVRLKPLETHSERWYASIELGDVLMASAGVEVIELDYVPGDFGRIELLRDEKIIIF